MKKRRRNLKAGSSSGTTEGLDMISALPQHLIEEILSRLSLRDAVRTCVLSSKWREKWTTLPRIVFDEYCISPPCRSLSPEAIAKAIDTIFALHQGPVIAFELVLAINSSKDSDVCRWIHHLSGLSIKELKFHPFGSNRIHYLQSYLFACQDLISLDLIRCSFNLPSNFTGFKKLRNLVFRPAFVAQDTLENLISSCPQLVKLEITVPPGPDFKFNHLRITAPNLQHLKVDGRLNTLKIDAPSLQHLDLECLLVDINVNTYCLLSLRLGYFDNWDGRYEKTDAIYRCLLKLFVQQSQLKRVDLDNYFIQYLSLSGFPDTLCNSLVHLKHLNIWSSLSSVEEVSATLCLLRNCPTLESIEIEFSWLGRNEGSADAVSKFLQGNSSSCLFKHLKNMWVRRISNNQAERSFIKFVMSSSPILEKMFISTDYHKGCVGLLRELRECPRRNRALGFYMKPGDMLIDAGFDQILANGGDSF